MISLPRLPTDNLYKLIALSGLLMAFGVYVGLEYAWFQAYHQWIEHKAQYDLFKDRFQDSKADLEALEKRFAGLTTKEFDIEAENLQELGERYRAESTQFLISAKQIEFSLNRLAFYSRIRSAAIIVGLVLAAFGFTLWYFKVQLPTDRKLAQEAGITDGRPPVRRKWRRGPGT
jgi:hypothetical protein